jgi:hypothetical protein
VYDALLKKAKYTDAERFACVVAHPRAGTEGLPDHSLVGVVELSIQGDADVKEVLGVDEYCASRRTQPANAPCVFACVFVC